jgi:hypothetical protein
MRCSNSFLGFLSLGLIIFIETGAAHPSNVAPSAKEELTTRSVQLIPDFVSILSRSHQAQMRRYLCTNAHHRSTLGDPATDQSSRHVHQRYHWGDHRFLRNHDSSTAIIYIVDGQQARELTQTMHRTSQNRCTQTSPRPLCRATMAWPQAPYSASAQAVRRWFGSLIGLRTRHLFSGLLVSFHVH